MDAETHVSSGGTAELTIYNYGYGDDTYYVVPQCSGIVAGCQGRGRRYAGAFSSVTTDVTVSVTQQSGTGSAGASIASTQAGGEVDGVVTVYGQPLLVIDSAQTPVYTADQNVSRCAAACFTSTASISTVPFYTLGSARNVTLVYNQDMAHPEPFIYANVSPAADGPAVSGYLMSATLNGAPVTFTNGETTIHFLSPGNVPARLGGQVSLTPGGPEIYDLVVNVVVQYASGGTSGLSYSTILPVYDASNSPIAHGWTIAGIDKLDCRWDHKCLTYGSDGSMTVFTGTFPYYNGSDSSFVYYSSLISLYVRTHVDGHKSYYDQRGNMVAVESVHGLVTNIAYDSSQRVIQISDPARSAGQPVPYIQLAYGAYGLASITETGGPGPSRVTTVGVDANRYLDFVTDPDGNSTSVIYYGVNLPIGVIKDRRGQVTYFDHDQYNKLSAVQSPAIPVDAGGGNTTSAAPVTYLTAWQGIGVPTSPTAGAPPTAEPMSSIMAMIQAPGSRTTQFSVNAWGQPRETFDPTGQRTVVTYSDDNRGQDAILVEHADFSEDSFAYDGLHRMVMSKPAGDSAAFYYYNAASQVDSVRGRSAVAADYHYNSDNTPASMSDASGVSMNYAYNAWKEVVSATDNAGHTTTYGYDNVFLNQDTVIAPGNRVSTTTMDNEGRPWVTSVPLSASQSVVYDRSNRPIQITQAGRPATVLTYDPLFRTDVTDANGNVTHTTYNALGWPIARRDASGAEESFRYDAVGNLTSWSNRRGDVMSYSYDAQDRLVSRSGRGIDDRYSYSPDSPNGNVMVAWNAVATDSVFQQPVVGNHLGADSTVTWVNGVRYRVVHGHVGALGMDDSTAISASSNVGFRNRYAHVGTDGLVDQIRDGFNTASVGHNGEALPSSLQNPSYGTRSTDNTALHACSAPRFVRQIR
ncbi:MAG: hypothetical protein ACR2M1_16765, partial [Gemmatimonadaceae bacterium]